MIVDGLWGEPARARARRRGSRASASCSSASRRGRSASLQSGWVRGKVANILGHSLFSTPPAVLASGYRELCEHARDGRIAFEIERYPLEQIAAAWERQASGSPGAKIVVTVC